MFGGFLRGRVQKFSTPQLHTRLHHYTHVAKRFYRLFQGRIPQPNYYAMQYLKGILNTTTDPYFADYNVYVAYSLDPQNRTGDVCYIIQDRNGNIETHCKTSIIDTTSVRLQLLCVWSALLNIKNNKSVRIITNDTFFIEASSYNRLDDGANKDLKKRLYMEMNRMECVCLSLPLTATDKSMIDECKEQIKIIRRTLRNRTK